jgi:hypothetical protein
VIYQLNTGNGLDCAGSKGAVRDQHKAGGKADLQFVVNVSLIGVAKG